MIFAYIWCPKGGKTKILFPIYYEEARPPTAGVPETVIEKEEVRNGAYGGLRRYLDFLIAE